MILLLGHSLLYPYSPMSTLYSVSLLRITTYPLCRLCSALRHSELGWKMAESSPESTCQGRGHRTALPKNGMSFSWCKKKKHIFLIGLPRWVLSLIGPKSSSGLTGPWPCPLLTPPPNPQCSEIWLSSRAALSQSPFTHPFCLVACSQALFHIIGHGTPFRLQHSWPPGVPSISLLIPLLPLR